ncbi:MAG: hypothetical protein LBR92_02960 [Puniceicoccales bacterium]|jgi:hypothetical protein|nr:hypothetical protein [Puniceicoccales bacterium]
MAGGSFFSNVCQSICNSIWGVSNSIPEQCELCPLHEYDEFGNASQRYSPNGAYMPYSVVDPSSSIEESRAGYRKKLSDREKEILHDMRQLLDYLQSNTLGSDGRLADILEWAEEELQYAYLEGIGQKGNYASLRAIDGMVSVATYFLTQKIIKKKKNELKCLLSLIQSGMRFMACNTSAQPYWENIAKNMEIASQILGVDLSLGK